MLPMRIDHSCGNSSRLVLRRNDPIGVSHCWGFSSRWVARVGVFTRMVRNLGIQNSWLFLPTLCDQYRTGPLEVMATAKEANNSGNKKISKLIIATVQSNILFMI